MSDTKGMLSSVPAVPECENLSLIQDFLKTVYTATQWTHVEIFKVELLVKRLMFKAKIKKNLCKIFWA